MKIYFLLMRGKWCAIFFNVGKLSAIITLRSPQSLREVTELQRD